MQPAASPRDDEAKAEADRPPPSRSAVGKRPLGFPGAGVGGVDPLRELELLADNDCELCCSPVLLEPK